MSTLCRGVANCDARTVDLYRPGYMAQTAGPGQAPSSPIRANEQEIDRANGQLDQPDLASTAARGSFRQIMTLKITASARGPLRRRLAVQSAGNQSGDHSTVPEVANRGSGSSRGGAPAPAPPETCDGDDKIGKDCGRHRHHHWWWWWRHDGWRHDGERDRWAWNRFDDHRREDQTKTWKSFDHVSKNDDHPWKNFDTWHADRHSLPISNLTPIAHPPIGLKPPNRREAL